MKRKLPIAICYITTGLLAVFLGITAAKCLLIEEPWWAAFFGVLAAVCAYNFEMLYRKLTRSYDDEDLPQTPR